MWWYGLNPRLVLVFLEYCCAGLGIELGGGGDCKCSSFGGLTVALPIAAGSPPTFGIVVKVQNRKRIKRWDNSNLATFLDSKIQVQEATNLNN